MKNVEISININNLPISEALKSHLNKCLDAAVANEREACAKIAENMGDDWLKEDIAKAIRERGGLVND